MTGNHSRIKPFFASSEDLIIGKCAETDPEAFYPGTGRPDLERQAKEVCYECKVRQKCLEVALRRDERFGVWGGLSTKERDRLRRGRKLNRPLSE